MRYYILFGLIAVNVCTLLVGYFLSPSLYWFFILFGPLLLIGFYDFFQTKKAILRNFPIIGHFRYLFEMIRPEIQQYFIESDVDGRPFSRELRSIVYQRAKQTIDSLPFGSKRNHYANQHEWLNHSMAPVLIEDMDPRVEIGNKDCRRPYLASILNISAMSYGSLSSHAIMALNRGAKTGNFAHNTGEGGISPYHLRYAGDLIWQIGTGYFGCRENDGSFSPEMFKESSRHENVKMIEIKLSQGAKPGHGGILPGHKVTQEIAKIRSVEVGKTVYSPPGHSKFTNPLGLVQFIAELRELSGGKPVGFKLCLGKKSEFLGVCKAMIEQDVYPDFITVDGSEGGTGAAPLEFSNSIGNPLHDGLNFIYNSLVALGIKKHIKLIASGRVITGFDMLRKFALGADLCYSARGMMFSIGCIQALRCNTNDCPTGVATQDKALESGLVVKEKYLRVANYHRATICSMLEMLGSAGLRNPTDIMPYHVQKRVNNRETYHYGEIYPVLKEGAYEEETAPEVWQRSWWKASSERF